MDLSATDKLFLELMREESGNASLSLESALQMPLAKTVLRSLAPVPERQKEVRAAPRPEITIESASTLSDPKSAIQAAIRDTFVLSELGPSPTDRDTLIASADLVMIAGQRRLRLRDDIRADILEKNMSQDLYASILRDAVADDVQHQSEITKDLIRLPSVWLRRMLTGIVSQLETAPPIELKAALQARERLRLLKSLPQAVPTIEDLARRVELAELLEPLRVLIGAEGGWDGTPRRDRFVGRKNELTKLRSFVDELASQSLLEAATRFASNARQTLLGSDKPLLLAIQARGGLGKSTLLAKFLLDHAMQQARPFPFAYLDFDRATLDAGRPLQLLVEIARQVALQFPQAKAALDGLAQNVRAEFVGSTQNNATIGIRDPYAAFVEIIRQQITLAGQRAFLLVFDTMEAVQWNSVAMDRLASLLYEFRVKGLTELKVVVSGRADIPELRRINVGNSPRSLELQPLQVTEAADLAQTLGRLAIGEQWNPSWSGAVAGRKEERARREPLAVRVAVDLIVRAPAEDREKLVGEISGHGFDTHKDFIARLYYKRIVNHVRNPLAQKLAWPGLIVRRVTVEIINEFLGPLCDITPDQSQAAFEALEREVWLVTREGDALKHRPDLRARTLPLMRNAEPAQFDNVARSAVWYFGKCRSRSLQDRGEWIYHRLLVGEAPEDVADDLSEHLLPLLARAADDFPPDSAAASYLASRTAKTRLAPSRIRKLRTGDALYHLSRTSANTFALDDVSIDRVAQEISTRSSVESELDPTLEPWARALWIKAGIWQLPSRQRIRPAELKGPLLRAHLFWAARYATTLAREDQDRIIRESVKASEGELDTIGLRSAIQLLAMTRVLGSTSFEIFDRGVTEMLSRTKANPAPSMQAALRSAIQLGQASRRPALKLWLVLRSRASSERVEVPSTSLAELKALIRINPEAENYLSHFTDQVGDGPARFTDPETVSTADRVLEETSYAVIDRQPGVKSAGVSRLFACRDEDWIIPMAYAAQRAYKRPLSGTPLRQLAFYDRGNRRNQADVGSEMLLAMRIADEAADLRGFANQLLADCDPETSDTQDLHILLECHAAWRRAIDNVVGTEGPPSQASVAPSENIWSSAAKKIREVISGSTPAAGMDSPSSSESRPPHPGPILNSDDPQKNRWGGQSRRDGRQVTIRIDSVESNVFYFSAIVEPTDSSSLVPPVIFHLHDSYPRSIVTIRKIENQQAILREWSAEGVFTIGVQVRDAKDQWTSLEIDLANTEGVPKRFLER